MEAYKKHKTLADIRGAPGTRTPSWGLALDPGSDTVKIVPVIK